MTVEQAIRILSKLPKNLELWMPYDGEDFSHVPIEKIRKGKIRLTEDPDQSDYKQKKNGTYSKEDCVFIEPEI